MCYFSGKEINLRFYLTPDYREVVSSKLEANQNANRIISPWRCYCFKGQSPALYLLWSNPVITIKFANRMIPNQFIIIYGNSERAIWQNTHNPFISYIVDHGLYHSTDREDISLKAFSESCVAVKTDSTYKITFQVENISFWNAAYLIVGIDIFMRAKRWSRNRYIQYSACVAVYVMASILFLMIYLRRQFEQSQRVSFIMIAAVMAPFWCWTYIMKQMMQYWQYILGYVLVGFGVCYKYGPVTDSRSLNLIQWFIQLVSLVLIYQGTQIPELSVAIMAQILIFHNTTLPKGWYMNRFTYYIRYQFFTPKRKFLTEDEYIKQAKEETEKALEEHAAQLLPESAV